MGVHVDWQQSHLRESDWPGELLVSHHGSNLRYAPATPVTLKMQGGKYGGGLDERTNIGALLYFCLRNAASGSGYPIHEIVAKHLTFIGFWTFQGRLFLVEDYLDLVKSANINDSVKGEVYRCDSIDVLEILDDYLEFDIWVPDRSPLRREVEAILLEEGSCLSAWIYLYNRPTGT
jgi:gamma-glutamylcyclotransferase (GGCT)/AIG2-like uncharacterized protein YtfP